jgi:hypothetical protein
VTKPRPLPGLATGLFMLMSACGSDNPAQPQPTPSPTTAPAPPVLVSPVGGEQVGNDTPTFVVRNAAPGFGPGQGTYIFDITSDGGLRRILTFSAPAGDGTTSAAAPEPLPRGMVLRWQVTASNGSAEQVSTSTTFRLPAVNCQASGDPYAKDWVDWFVPGCSLAMNHYNDPDDVLGEPDAGGRGPDSFFGFLSLGFEGWIDVDMRSCAEDRPGADVRVWQAVSSEGVVLYAAGRPEGPYVRIRGVRNCGRPSPDEFSNYCDFDLAEAEIEEARYFRVEDGEGTPCNQAGTPSEGADIDAVEILHPTP